MCGVSELDVGLQRLGIEDVSGTNVIVLVALLPHVLIQRYLLGSIAVRLGSTEQHASNAYIESFRGGHAGQDVIQAIEEDIQIAHSGGNELIGNIVHLHAMFEAGNGRAEAGSSSED